MAEEVEALMRRALAEALEWKGRALAAAPALKVALDALETLDFIQCPWCSEFIDHTLDCKRGAVIKVLRDALSGGQG